MPLSISDLNIINLRNQAVPNRRYYGNDGRVYIGTKEGRLRLENSATEVTFSETSSIDANNVQDAIENISDNANTNAQDAVGSILTDTTTIGLTYDSSTPSIYADLLNTAVTAGTYGSATQVPQFVVDAQGRLTSAINVAIAIPPGTISLTQDHILVGNNLNVAADVAMSGDVNIISTGATTIQPNVVSYSKIQQVAASRLLGNPTGALANTSEISLNSSLTFSGTSLSVVSAPYSTNVTITDDTTTNATMYPTWVTANSGNLPINVSSTKLNFNPSTGSLTSTGNVITPQIYGSTAANGDILIDGTSSATKTSSSIILQPTGGNLSIGTATPGTTFITTISNSNLFPRGLTSTNVLTTASANFSYAVGASMDITPQSDISTAHALNIGMFVRGTQSITSLTSGMQGVQLVCNNFSNGNTLTNWTGYYTNVNNSSTGTVTNLNCHWIQPSSNAGTIVNWYGIRVDNQTITTTLTAAYHSAISAASNRYNLYMVGTAQNYLAGSLGVGVTAPTVAKLEVAKSNTSTAIGNDGLMLLQNTSATNNNWNTLYFSDANSFQNVGIGIQTTDHTNHLSDFIIATRSIAGTYAERLRLNTQGNLSLSNNLNTTGTTTSSSVNFSFTSLTSGTGLYVATSTLTSGKALDIQVTGTAALTNQVALNIGNSGATTTNAQTTYGVQITNTRTNVTSGTNVGLICSASGATTANYAALFTSGNVGIGTASPTELLHISNGNILLKSTNSANDPNIILDANNNGDDTKISFRRAGLSDTSFINAFHSGTSTLRRLDLGIGSTTVLSLANNNNVGFGGNTTPTALIHLAAGTATASTAPLKFTSGTNLTTAEAGAIEYNGSNFFATATASNRRQLVLSNVATPSNGFLPIGNGIDFTLAALTAGTGITITNASGSITVANTVNIQEAVLDLSSAQIKALYTTPIQIVAAPGAGKYIEFISGSVTLTFVSAAYTASQYIVLTHDSATPNDDVAYCLILDSTATRTISFNDDSLVSGTGTGNVLANTALYAGALTANPATGDGTARVRVLYAIRNT